MSITINLNHTQTDKFDEKEFLHQDEDKKFSNLISKNLELLKNLELKKLKKLKNKRVHNTILINGKRGYGKTSFMLTMIEKFKNEEDLFILKIIDPTIVETKENIFILVLSLIKKEVEECFNPCRNNISQQQKEKFDKSLKELASGLNVLDGIGGNTLFKESVWNESELILDDALKNVKGGSDLEENFKKFLDTSLEILNKKAFLLVFDDIDTAANQGEMILELIRKYFTSPQLFVVLLGDSELFNLIIRNMQWKKLSPQYIKSYEENLIENLYVDEIDTLTHQYSIKILPIENRIKLKGIYHIADSIEISEDNNKIKLIEFIRNEIIDKIFKETNEQKITIFKDFLLKLPLRSVIQILQTKGELELIRNILLGNIKIKYIKNLSEILKAFQISKNDKYYLLYKYIKKLNSQEKEFEYTFLPQENDESKNSLNFLLNAHISYGTTKIQDIFDYFIKFYMPLEFNINYDSNTHSFKIVRYFIKDLRKDNINKKVINGTIFISNNELKKLKFDPKDQTIFNIFAVGLFTNSGLRNYFSFWNLFGFISDLFLYENKINLNKLLQVRSFYLEDLQESPEEDSKIQEAEYDITTLIESLNMMYEKEINIDLSNRQINSIWTRIQYAVKYIDDNPSKILSEQLQRYIQATLNAFIVVTLENEQNIKFNNALSLNSNIYIDNLNILKKYSNKYLWLINFVELPIWNMIKEFSKKLNVVVLTFDFIYEFSKINFDGSLKDIQEAIINKSEYLSSTDITKIITAIKQRKTIDKKLKEKLIKELDKIRTDIKTKEKNIELNFYIAFNFIREFSKIKFEGELKNIQSAIINKSEYLSSTDITKIITAIKQRKTIDKKLKEKLIKELEKIQRRNKIKRMQ
jgi:hypothetical protein